jgi:diguanylate cyclase (GGDEF)-like protein
MVHFVPFEATVTSPLNVPPAHLGRRSLPLFLAFGLIAALCIFFVLEVIDLRKAINELRANEVARIEIRSLLVDLLDAETGQRGYILTGDERYLASYAKGRNAVRARLKKLVVVSRDEERFAAAVRELSVIGASKLDELERTVQLKKRSDGAAALEVVMNDFGRHKMEQARKVIDRELDRYRVARDQTIAEINKRLSRMAILLVLILSAVVSLAVLTWRSLAGATRKNNDLARRLAQEALHDALTRLANRRFFDMWAHKLLARHGRDGTRFALMLIDLDGFKKVNDSFGHATGDEVLKEVAVRFQASLRSGEFLARLGGDEFAVIIDAEVSNPDVARLGRRLINSLSTSLAPGLPDGAVGASIGVAYFPQHGAHLDALAGAADKALYESKSGGRGMVSFAPDGVEIGHPEDGAHI